MSSIVTISALDAGHLTLPERLFVTDADPEKRTTVPSLAFLIQHEAEGKTTNLIFDLGLKRDLNGYAPAQQQHTSQRQPVITDPDCAASLRAGGLDPTRDIDIVIISHVHWDHIGTPSDFSNAKFIVGSGTLDVLANGDGPWYPAEIFNRDELPQDRTVELPPAPGKTSNSTAKPASKQTDHQWKPLTGFPNTIDFFGDGSVYVIDSPGHLCGHVNILAQIAKDQWVYLGGDCCHDPRMLNGEKGIALYDDGKGGLRSVHSDTEAARGTLDRIGEFLKASTIDGKKTIQVEAIVAHDKGWRENNAHRFFPGTL